MPFIIPDKIPTPFHIVSIAGPPKVGKTDFACKAPGVVAFQSLDFGTDGVVQKHMSDEHKIVVAEYSVEVDLTADSLLKDHQNDAAAKAADRQAERVTNQLWTPLVTDYRAALAEPEIRTIVWDRADEVNEMLRLANFGRLERNPQLGYVPVNAEYKQLVRLANQAKKNLILIHGMDKEYKEIQDPSNPNRTKSVETGRLKRLGNSRADYLVHSFLEFQYTEPGYNTKGEKTRDGEWFIKVLRARLNPEVNGMTLPSMGWRDLMTFLMPDVPPEAWGDAL